MFDSIIAQKWDNIQLILVNDGSTDGTREKITEYEPKFKTRGYEVVIINQENQGVAAAVRNGMLHLKGEYFCTVDSDDSLAPDYLEIMAGWLEENPDYAGVSCAFTPGEHQPNREHTAEDLYRLENYIFRRMELSACVYMVRTSYINKCNVVQNFLITPKCSQEPQLLVPMLAYDGKFKHLSKGLYIRCYEAQDKTRNDTFVKTIVFVTEYYELIEKSIQQLLLASERKDELLKLTKIGMLKTYTDWTMWFPEANDFRQKWISECVSLMLKNNACRRKSIYGIIDESNFSIFFQIFGNWLLRESPTVFPAIPKGRVVGCGASGYFAQKLIPFLKETPFYPTVLWDESAQASSYHGDIHITKPDFNMLNDDDLVLVFPKSLTLQKEIEGALRDQGCNAICVSHNQILGILGNYLS